MSSTYRFVLIGSGIMGLSIARVLKKREPGASILILDKEDDVARHASSRNSGVLHAGFYYTADSMKAKFTVDGNRAMKDYCRKHNLPVNECGKLVVARNAQELEQLSELERRGKANGSNVRIIDAEEAEELEPNIRTFQKALHSPDTASIDPGRVCNTLRDELKGQGVTFAFRTEYRGREGDTVRTNRDSIRFEHLINCAGLYADRVAKDFGFGKNYTMIPFKGIYLKYTKNTTDVRMNIYPVPNLKNPFLGVHFTKTVDGGIKIGPTAIPALWRENYKGFQNFRLGEMAAILGHEARLFFTNAFHFRDLAIEEIRKYSKSYLIGRASEMVREIDPAGFTETTAPGIRAQLLDLRTQALVQDFVVEGDQKSTHILNAVSPAFTCAFPFAQHVAEHHLSA